MCGCAGGGAVDIAALAAFGIDPALKQFIGSMYEELQADKAALQAELADERRERKEETRLLVGQVVGLQAALHEFSNKTRAETSQLKVDAQNTSLRLAQCETATHPFIQEMNRRRAQAIDHCHGTGVQTMLASCCPDGGGGHRRELQSGHGCAAFPDTCSVACSVIFNEFYEDCHESMIASMPVAEQAEFDSFYGACTEAAQQAAAALEGASPAMIFHVVVEVEQQAATANGGGGSGSDPSQFGPVNLPPTPSPSSDAGGAVAAQEFRRVCTTVNLHSCVPECNAVTYGFLLSIEIDGRGTVLTCNKVDGRFSWQGQASLGGYIGEDIESLVSSVVSGAAGTFLGTVTEDAGVLADLTIEPAQLLLLVGLASLAAAPAWGSGSFTVQERGSLTLEYIRLEGAITLQPGATALTLSSCENVNAVVSTGLEVPSGTAFTIAAVLPATVVLGLAPMAGHLAVHGPITFSNTNIITIAATAFGGASVAIGGGASVYLPNRLVPVLDGSMPGTLTASVDGQTVGTLSTSGSGAVSSVPLGWYTTLEPSLTSSSPSPPSSGGPALSTDPSSFWDSGDVVNANGNAFSLYLLPAQPPNTFRSGRSAVTYRDLCAAAGLQPVGGGNPAYVAQGLHCSHPILTDGATIGIAAESFDDYHGDDIDMVDLNCMPLPWPGAADPANAVFQLTGWSNIVTFDPLSGIQNCVFYPEESRAYLRNQVHGSENDAARAHWNDALHPVCAREV